MSVVVLSRLFEKSVA